MNDEIVLPQNNEIADLTSLAHRINEANQNAQDSSKKAVYYAIECGAALINAKSLVKHGEFQGWIEANCTVKYRQAAKYMKLAKHWPELSNVHSGALLELSINETLTLIAEPGVILLKQCRSACDKLKSTMDKLFNYFDKAYSIEEGYMIQDWDRAYDNLDDVFHKMRIYYYRDGAFDKNCSIQECSQIIDLMREIVELSTENQICIMRRLGQFIEMGLIQ